MIFLQSHKQSSPPHIAFFTWVINTDITIVGNPVLHGTIHFLLQNINAAWSSKSYTQKMKPTKPSLICHICIEMVVKIPLSIFLWGSSFSCGVPVYLHPVACLSLLPSECFNHPQSGSSRNILNGNYLASTEEFYCNNKKVTNFDAMFIIQWWKWVLTNG